MSASVRSGVAGRRSLPGEFHADPPIETQISRLSRYFDDLGQILQPGRSSPPRGKNAKQGSSSFTSCTENIQEALHKLLSDLWRTLRSAQRAGDDAQVQTLKGHILRQISDVSRAAKKLRAHEAKLIAESGVSDNLAAPIHTFCQDLANLIVQDGLDVAQKAIDAGDDDTARALYQTAAVEVGKFGDGLCDIEDSLISCVKSTETLNHEEVMAFAECVHHSRRDLFPQSLLLFKRCGEVAEPEEDPVFDVVKVFGKRIDSYSALCNELAQALSPESDDKSDDEVEIDENYVEFVKGECQKSGDGLVTELNAFWDWAHSQHWQEQSDSIGSLIQQFLEARVDCRDQTLKATDVSVPYNQAVRHNDDEAADRLKGLLVSKIEQQMSDLEHMRRQQLKNLAKTPSTEPELAEEYIATSKRLSQDIQKKATDLNKAICDGREAEFLLAQRPTPVQVDEEDMDERDEEEDIAPAGIFIQYDNEESTNIYNHLTDLRGVIDGLYLNISAARSSGASVSGRKSVSDATSVFSASSKMSSRTTRVTKAEMNRLVKHMSPEEVKQSLCLEDALSETYLQLFASINGMITAAIRDSDYNIAIDMNKKLKESTLEYVNHLTALKKRALEILDLEGAKEAERRLQELSANKNDELGKCIIASLRNLIELTICNYYRNCDDIDDKYQDIEDTQRKELDKRFGDMERKVHMPNLVILEKQLKVARKREEMRGTAAMTEKEDVIRTLAAKNDFAAAEREKKKLELARAEDLKARLDQVEAKFGKQRKQMMAQQQRDLQVLEDSFNAKMEHIAAQKEAEKKEQLNTLASSIRSSQQRHVQFAMKMLPLDAASKKELPTQFACVVRAVLKEQGLDKVIKIDSK